MRYEDVTIMLHAVKGSHEDGVTRSVYPQFKSLQLQSDFFSSKNWNKIDEALFFTSEGNRTHF
jgi:hypothetical protein